MHPSPWAPPPVLASTFTGLGRADLHLWLIDLDLSSAEIDRSRLVLSSDEIERAGRFHFARDVRRFIAAHAGLRSVLSRYVARAPEALAFQSTAHGKPFLTPGAPYAIPDLAFNLSHSGELALAAVARGRCVGVDIEQIRPDFASAAIAEHFFSPAEVSALRSLPPEEQTHAFFRCWTRKEAFVKARGEGLSLPLDSFDVAFLPGAPAALLRVGDEDALGRWHMHAVALPPHIPYEAAVTVEGPIGQVATWQLPKKP